MLPLHHRTICINFLSISSSPSCVTPNHRVSLERSKCVVSRYSSKGLCLSLFTPCGSRCPTRIRTLTDRTKTCSASHYTMGQILLLPTDTSVIVCECKGRKKKSNHQTFRRKTFSISFYIGGDFCFRVPGRPRAEALSSRRLSLDTPLR